MVRKSPFSKGNRSLEANVCTNSRFAKEWVPHSLHHRAPTCADKDHCTSQPPNSRTSGPLSGTAAGLQSKLGKGRIVQGGKMGRGEVGSPSRDSVLRQCRKALGGQLSRCYNTLRVGRQVLFGIDAVLSLERGTLPLLSPFCPLALSYPYPVWIVTRQPFPTGVHWSCCWAAGRYNGPCRHK